MRDSIKHGRALSGGKTNLEQAELAYLNTRVVTGTLGLPHLAQIDDSLVLLLGCRGGSYKGEEASKGNSRELHAGLVQVGSGWHHTSLE